MVDGSGGAVDEASALPRVGVGFFSLYMLAQIGAYLSFVPMLTILLPLKAAQIGGVEKASALAVVTICGSVTALFANPLAGTVSDRTRSRWGRRRPWIFVGVIGTVMSYAGIARAASLLQLSIGFMLFQLFFNVLFAPLNALVPDRVPDEQKGSVSGLIGLGLPVGSVVGVTLIGQLIEDSTGRFVAVSVILLLTVLPFVLLVREKSTPGTVAQSRPHSSLVVKQFLLFTPILLGLGSPGFWS